MTAEKGMLYHIQRMSVHDGPGIRTTVFFKGCPLRCLWCGNPESQNMSAQLMFFEELCLGCGRCAKACPHGAATSGPNGAFGVNRELCAADGSCARICPAQARVLTGREYGVEEVMAVIRKDASFYRASGGGVTFGGGECAMQSAFLLRLMAACRAEGLHNCVDTCGCAPAENFKEITALADLILFDLKHMDPQRHKALTGADNAIILRNLAGALTSNAEAVRIRMPLARGINDCDDNLAAMAAFLARFGKKNVEVMPCHSLGRGKYAALGRPAPQLHEYTAEELQAVLKRFAAHGLNAAIV